jgi:hypothetical protein
MRWRQSTPCAQRARPRQRSPSTAPRSSTRWRYGFDPGRTRTSRFGSSSPKRSPVPDAMPTPGKSMRKQRSLPRTPHRVCRRSQCCADGQRSSTCTVDISRAGWRSSGRAARPRRASATDARRRTAVCAGAAPSLRAARDAIPLAERLVGSGGRARPSGHALACLQRDGDARPLALRFSWWYAISRARYVLENLAGARALGMEANIEASIGAVG